MFKAIAKLTAYLRAPAKTFALLHPLRAAKWLGIFVLVGSVLRRSSRRRTRRRTA